MFRKRQKRPSLTEDPKYRLVVVHYTHDLLNYVRPARSEVGGATAHRFETSHRSLISIGEHFHCLQRSANTELVVLRGNKISAV